MRSILRRLAIVSLILALAADAHPNGHEDLIHTGGGDMPALPTALSITTKNGYRTITASGLPDHEHGTFPNQGNPNPIVPQQKTFRMPLQPKAAPRPSTLGLIAFGVAVNGVPFEPSAAEFWKNDRRSGWQYEALSGKLDLGIDVNHAHVQPTGKYHYHGLPTGLVEKLGGRNQVHLLGWAADGFPIYGPWSYADPMDPTSTLVTLQPSYRLKREARPSGNAGPGRMPDGSFVQDYEYVKGHGDLDEFNGRFGKTPEYPDGTYYYVITESFPFIARSFRGTPDDSFRFDRGGPGGGRNGPGGRPRPGPRTIDSASLLGQPVVQRELNLTAKQSRVLYEAVNMLHRGQRTPNAYNLEPEERRQQRRQARRDAELALALQMADVLTEKQQQRFDQLRRQTKGPALLLEPEIRKQLNLSDTRYREIYTMIVAARAHDTSDTAVWRQVMERLTPEQERQLENLLGSRVTLSTRRPDERHPPPHRRDR